MDKIIRYIIRKKSTHEFVGVFNATNGVQVQSNGRPTVENLERWRQGFNNSLFKGGANEHLGIRYWLQCTLEIYDQCDDVVVCELVSPMFEFIE